MLNRKNMRCASQRRRRRRAATALVASVVAVLAASTVTATTSQTQEGCEVYNADSEAMSWNTTYATEKYFGCADGGFLVAVEATQDETAALDALSWTCSGGEVIGTSSSRSDAEGWVEFTVGIWGVSTSELYNFPYLAEMEVGGFDATDDGTGVGFSWKGPLGGLRDSSAVLPNAVYSYCEMGALATGVTVWSDDSYVHGVILECASVTATCAPPNYPANLIEEGEPTPGPSSVVPTPGPSPSPVLTEGSSVNTAGSSSASVDTAAAIFTAVGVTLLLIAAVVGVAWYIRHRSQESKICNSGKIPPGIAGVGPMSAEGGQASRSGRSTPPPSYADLAA